jgi:hypothetical protein
MASEKAKVEKAKAQADMHQWYACLALERAFAGGHGQRGSLDWTQVVEAAFHAGAAKAFYDARKIFE